MVGCGMVRVSTSRVLEALCVTYSIRSHFRGAPYFYRSNHKPLLRGLYAAVVYSGAVVLEALHDTSPPDILPCQLVDT
jgi:hypothetical protein